MLKRIMGNAVGVILGAAILIGGAAIAALTVPEPGFRLVDGFSIVNAINNQTDARIQTVIGSVAATRASCTQINAPLVVVGSASVANGSVCLPPAVAGMRLWIATNSSSTVNLYSSNSPFTPGTPDFINGVTGATANTTVLPAAGLTASKQAFCFVSANTRWHCNIATGP